MPGRARSKLSLGGSRAPEIHMPAPHKFTRKLHEAIGPEAADAMVDWMNQTDDRIDGLRQEVAEFRSEMRADFAELRQEMSALSASIDVRFAGVDAKFA